MHKLKNIFNITLYTVYAFFSSYFTPSILSVTFNFTHGVANNPDGELLVPIGIITIFAILIIDLLFIVKTIKSNNVTKNEKMLTILFFVIVKIIGLMMDPDGGRNFLHCFKKKFMQ